MATPSRADLDGPLHDQIEQYFQAGGAGAARRIRLFRLAWDFLGSELGGRGELYERFYLRLVADDRARLQDRRQVVSRVAGGAVPARLMERCP
jgi:aromatic ring hydroxylase